jgi:hypothetical protein
MQGRAAANKERAKARRNPEAVRCLVLFGNPAGFRLVHPIDRRVMGHLGWLDESGVKTPSLACLFQKCFRMASQSHNRQPFFVFAAPDRSGLDQVPFEEWAAVLVHSGVVVLVAEVFQVIVCHRPKASDFGQGLKLGFTQAIFAENGSSTYFVGRFTPLFVV